MTTFTTPAESIAAASRSLDRLRPRLHPLFTDESRWQVFSDRLDAHFPDLFALLLYIYGDQYDFFYHLEAALTTAAQAFLSRPAALRDLDATRSSTWFQDQAVVGGVCYVDRYAGTLAGIRDRIPYFRELGLTYLHLMPLFKCPPERNDGGYAVSSFREVNPALGTLHELAALAADLRAEGISLALDLVFNHTSDEHEWARKAKAGDPDYQAYYKMYPDRTLPDQYERTLREIFPEQAPGNFTFVPEVQQWVWTTFNTYQWDLNYANPVVFTEMLDTMLFLANQGVQVLRLDAVAFIWKQMGTSCENLPQAHAIIAAYNQLLRIAAPAVIFKSEAIVHPDEVIKYIGRECQISYHPTLMVLLWESLATREVRLLRHTMEKRFTLPPDTAWVNYIRVHDDIGWSFADEDAAELGINGYDHRQFLNAFYTGQFPGSFARGLPFNYNAHTGDMRISGTAASLAGLESALDPADPAAIALAVARLVLIQGLTIAIGGIPLIYLNDELGILNDYSYRHDPAKADDSRWVHRPRFDQALWAARHDQNIPAGQIFYPIHRMIAVRKQSAAFSAAGKAAWPESGNPHVLLVERSHAGELLVILANFSEQPQLVSRRALPPIGLHDAPIDLLTELPLTTDVSIDTAITLPPYGMLWLRYR